MSTKTISVGSRLTMNIGLGFKHEGRDVVITGLSHPTTDSMAVTPDVPEEDFKKWSEKFAETDMVAGGYVFALPDDFDAKPREREFGHQAALDRLAADDEQTKLAEKGTPDEIPQPVVNGVPAAVPLPDKIMAPVVKEPAKPAEPPKPPAGEPAKIEQGEVEPGAAQDDPKNDVNLKV